MVDDFTMSMRLCDDQGLVSDEPIEGENIDTADQSYLERLNRMRGETLRGLMGEHVDKIVEPFACTGSAHLMGEHIRCTSTAHWLQPWDNCERCGVIKDSPRHNLCVRCATIKWEDCGGARDHFDSEGIVMHYNGTACIRLTMLDRRNEARRGA